MRSVLDPSLGDFLVIAEAVLNISARDLTHTARRDLAESALASPQANFEGQELYPRFEDKAAVLCSHLIRNHPLVDGNKPVGYLCLVEFVERNGYVWTPPPGDEHDGEETVRVIEAVAAGTMGRTDARRLDSSPNHCCIDEDDATDGLGRSGGHRQDRRPRSVDLRHTRIGARARSQQRPRPPPAGFRAARLARDNRALVLRFNFPYAERGGSSPDPRPVLEDTYRRAYDLLVHDLLQPGAPVFVGGKSLGGRFAAEFVAGTVEGEALAAAGLVAIPCMRPAGKTG